MKRVGDCTNCGICCRNVQFVFRGMDPKAKKFYSRFGGITVKDVKDITFITVKAECKYLKWVGEKSYCSIYGRRPKECKKFPWMPEQIDERCGYKFKAV